MTAKILHLSDIHFHGLSEGENDPDSLYRDAILEIVRTSAAVRSFDCIFVTGDIAAKGRADEYAVAKSWLDKVATEAKCGSAGVFVVPGNHDVDRSVTGSNEMLKLVQSTVSTGPSEWHREDRLKRMMSDPATGPVFFRHLEAYNTFASNYQCEIGPSEHGRWIRYVPLDHGYRLKIFGLTSVLCSSCSPPGDDDVRGQNLYVGPFQSAYRRELGEIGVVLIHHPPDWLIDGDLQNRRMKNDTTLHLLGHKHDRDVETTADYVRFGAGAVNPNRHEGGFEPGFNIIELEVTLRGASQFVLNVQSEIWTWQENPAKFRRHQNRKGDEIWSACIDLPAIPVDAEPMIAADRLPPPSQAAAQADGYGPYVQRFWALPVSSKRRIAEALELLNDDERRLPERYRYANMFGRAVSANKIDALIEAIRAAGEFA